MKRLSLLITTMVLTLLLSSAAYANFLGMEDAGNYEWVYTINQQITNADGSAAEIAYGGTEAEFVASITGKYLWGVVNLTQVFDNDENLVWPTDNSTAPPTFVEPASVTGVFWGIQIAGVNATTGNIEFTGGEGAFYYSLTDYLTTIAVPTAQPGLAAGTDMTDWFEGEYGYTDADQLLTVDWVGGVNPYDPTITQVASFNYTQQEVSAQGLFNMSVTSDTDFGEHIDSDYFVYNYGQLLTIAADIQGSTPIDFTYSNNTFWDVLSNSGQAYVHAVPEPSTFLLIGAGMIGCFAFARRRRNNA